MKLIHRHRWEEVGRVYAPSSLQGADWLTKDAFDKATFGVTSIELRCSCGRVREEVLIGDHTQHRHPRLA